MTMIRTIVHIGVLLCLAATSVCAQTPSADPSQDILPPSPNAAAFTKYVDFPVNTSTGLPNINIPLGTLQGRGINVPVSLDYHAGGIKVDEVASIVGLGWSLDAGGVVSRTVQGLPDESAEGYIGHADEIPPSPITTSQQFTNMQAFAAGNWDGQADVFSFNFGGYSGKFVLDGANVRLIPKQDLKVSYTTCSGGGCPAYLDAGSIISVTITTPDGVQYLFGTTAGLEYSTTTSYNVSGSSNCAVKNFTAPVVTAWHLKSITNPRTNDVITFTYATNKIIYDLSYNESFRFRDPNNDALCSNGTVVSKCVTQKTDNGVYLTSISSSKGRVDFISNATRSDVTLISGMYRVNEVKFYGLNNTLLRSYQLTQNFVQSTGSTPSTATTSLYRMYLDEVKELDAAGAILNSRTFEYESRTALPPRLSYKQDHWGYFNNKNNTQLTPFSSEFGVTLNYIQSLIGGFIPANRDPVATYAKYGQMKRMNLPTGGYIDYEFEGNEVAVCNTVNVPTATSASAALTFAGTPQTLTQNFTIGTGQTVNITYHVLMNGFRCDGASAKVKTLDAGNNFATLSWGGCAQLSNPVELQGTVSAYMKPGNYQIEVKVFQGSIPGYPTYPFNTLPEDASVNIQYTTNVPTYIANQAVGGLRIKKLTASDKVGVSPNIVKAYQYTKPTGCANASSGEYMGRRLRYSTLNYSVVDKSGSGGLTCSFVFCNTFQLSSTSVANLTNNAGNVVSYRELTVLDGDLGQNGKAWYKHEIFSDADPQQGPNAFNIFLTTPTVDYSWKSGKVVEEKTYSASGQLVSHTLNDYEFNETNDKHTLKSFVARKVIDPPCPATFIYYCDGTNEDPEEFHVVYEPCGLPGNLCPVAYTTYFPCYNQPAGTAINQSSDALQPYAFEWYDAVSQFVYLKKTTKRIYDSNGSGNYVETVSDYQYDTPLFRHHMQTKTIQTNSDGTQYATRTVYPPEYTATPANDIPSVAIKNLQDNYMIGSPVEIVQTIKKTAQSELVTGGQLIRYKNFGGAKIFPNEVWKIGTTSPISSFTYSSISGGNFSQASQYYQVQVLGAYDANGSLLEWNKTDDQVSSFIYWNNSLAPVAYVRNAASNETAYTSFEDASQTAAANNGNWTISGAGGWVSTAGYYYTGKYGYNISSTHTITRSGVPAGKYVVSFFYRDGIISVNGTAGSASANSTWQYAEVPLTFAGGSNPVTVTGAAGAYIDELRLQPADALMRTFSVDNNSLLTLSASDEGSVPSHYEYDNIQRLLTVRDQDRNILQTYEYNYQVAGPGINDVKTRKVLTSGQTTIAQVNALTGSNVTREFQYFDGLGRLIQKNEIGQSPSQNDVVTIKQYDAFGRESKVYLPYTVATNSGTYRPFATASADQLAFANLFGAGGYGYNESKYEASPMNRVIEQGAPGANFRIGTGHTPEVLYRGNANSTSETVRDFTNNVFFAANQLTVEEETDENERKKFTFKDKLGRVVLVKQQVVNAPSNPPASTDYALTYTIYDDFGRVAAIIPPQATKLMAGFNIWTYTHTLYTKMIYLYTYDSRGRQISKTVPMGGTTTTWYDRLDRPVLTKDANAFQIFTRYDILGRPVMSGRYKGVATPGTSEPLFETPNTTAPHYYSSTSFPTDNNLDVYKVMYYDDYDLDNSGSLGASETYTNPAESGYETAAFTRVRGKDTAVKTAILNNDNSAPTTYLTTRKYYDKEYSVIQINKQNHLNGADVTSSAYDFANRLTKTRRDHTATVSGNNKAYTIREDFEYDHAGRMRYRYHQIGAQKKEVLSKTSYDEMGRMNEKNLYCSNFNGTALPATQNYLQSMDYAYNIRGWLTGINNVGSCAIQGSDNLADLFSMGLEYETGSNGGTPLYNGNISTMQWRTNINGTCGTQQLYRFSYDAANRLAAADHRTWNGSAWTDPGQYNESNITYDLNGNLKTYTRQGLVSGTATFGTIDNLTYYYDDGARPDRLSRVIDAASATKGFVYVSTASPAYLYDANGNLTQDKHKDLTFSYNYMNLPNNVVKTTGGTIGLSYTADGEKLSKTAGGVTRNYVSGIEYNGANLEAIYHKEGRCTPNGAGFFYEYSLKDHLGNARVNFRANGTAVTYLEDFHYYPFGMLMEGIGAQASPTNGYRYNSKELNVDLGLNWYDYGKRWYDPVIGRFPGVDPLADTFNFVTPYNYAENEPTAHIDLWGLQKFKYIEKPSDVLSMKMVNNLCQGAKALAKEVVSEKVGKMMNKIGDAAMKTGTVASVMFMPEVGVPLMAIGVGAKVVGYGIIAADKMLSGEKVDSETKAEFVVDAAFFLIPKALDVPLERTGLPAATKEVVKSQIELVNEATKVAVEKKLHTTDQERH